VRQCEKRKSDDNDDESRENQRAAVLFLAYVETVWLVSVQFCYPVSLAVLPAELGLLAKVFDDSYLKISEGVVGMGEMRSDRFFRMILWVVDGGTVIVHS